MRIINFIVLAVCGLLVGCDPVARETITLQLPAESEGDTAKSAVTLIDESLKGHAFVSARLFSTNSDPTVVGLYGGVGKSWCSIAHKPGEIEVVFSEFGKFRSRREIITARDDLRKLLLEKFGKDKVSP